MKTCTECKIQKPSTDFTNLKRSPDGLHTNCRRCINLKKRNYGINNRNTLNKYFEDYRNNNKDQIKMNFNKWKSENPERSNEIKKKYRDANKELTAFLIKEWGKNNPDKRKALYGRSRAKREKRIPPWLTKKDYIEMAAIYKKAHELTVLTGIPHHVDHIIPLNGKTVSGLHVPSNLQILTKAENLAKSNKF